MCHEVTGMPPWLWNSSPPTIKPKKGIFIALYIAVYHRPSRMFYDLSCSSNISILDLLSYPEIHDDAKFNLGP